MTTKYTGRANGLKWFGLVLIGLMFLSLSGAGALPVLAAGNSPINYPASSVFFIQNTSGTPITCTYTLYNYLGTAVYTSPTLTIAGNSVLPQSMSDINSLTSGSYSADLSCSQNVAVMS